MPVDVKAFLEDERVQQIIEDSRVTVKIHEESDDYDNLKADSNSISGLTSGKYYRVEEYDEDNTFIRHLFIQADGTHWETLGEIRRLTGTTITGLKSNYTYKVKAAELFAGSMSLQYFDLQNSAIESVAVSNGTIEIQGEYLDYYLDIAPGGIGADKNYEVRKIPVDGGTDTWGDRCYSAFLSTGTGPIAGINDGNYTSLGTQIGIYQYRTGILTSGGISLQDRSIILLPEEETANDYVFIELDGDDITSFTVLTVNRQKPPVLTITNVTFGWSAETDPQLSGHVASYTRGDSLVINIIVDNFGDYGTVEYQLDSDPIRITMGTNTIELDFSDDVNIGLWQLGTHTLTVFGDIYSTTIEFTVN